MKRLTGLICAAVLSGCGFERIVNVPDDSRSRTVVVDVAQEVRIVLGNVGPAIYESPPQMSSSALEFLDVDVVPPFTPAGPRQQFRFLAVRTGESIIHFRRLLGDSVVSVVEDTIRVQ